MHDHSGASSTGSTADNPPGLTAAAELFRVLAAEVRLAIVLELVAAPRSVQELVGALGVRQPLVSQHLRVLRAARLVTAERRARERVYRLVDDHVRHIVADALEHAVGD
ncbi:ArsR/SmtB family transcription factor [Pseudonocardia nigra]|uniref:ArsR/SmtB family transcription factor n=1 Tax=Pseudonocardia nigra TaxID=1921578 RepID=UPI001C5D7287|nr:metalloregulator ArsR/SmtB family transcription factor [Pseudonocardia nigra]